MPDTGDVLLVLAGGRSSRFGRDKACEPFGSSREPLALRTLRRLAAVAPRRVLVRAAPLAGVPDDVIVVADPRPGDGPLEALSAAFAAVPADRWFVAPCDLPWLAAAHYATLAAAIGAAPAAFVRGPRGDEPLVALWTRAAARQLAARQAGAPSEPAHVALAGVGAIAVPILGESGGRSFLNVNTQPDLAVAGAAGEDS